MQQIKKMGPLGKMLELLPGMGQLPADVDLSTAENDLKRIEAIIYSMTPQERRNPKLIKRNRKLRIAKGSGTSVPEINQLLRQFQEMQKMMRQMQKRGGMRQLAKLMGGRGMFG
jgi:signal recognition particle subunit SRP54